jgi:hypothetical protein
MSEAFFVPEDLVWQESKRKVVELKLRLVCCEEVHDCAFPTAWTLRLTLHIKRQTLLLRDVANGREGIIADRGSVTLPGRGI